MRTTIKGLLCGVVCSALLHTPLSAAGRDYPGLADCPELAGLVPLWERAVSQLDIPGAALVVVRGDKIIALQTHGDRNVETGAPVTPETMFYIASCTKPYTAAAVAALAEENRLNLDTPVKQLLPRFELADAAAAARITVRDLLCHRPGLNDGLIVYHDAYTGQITEDLYYRRLKTVKPTDQPDYTNVHFTLLGRVIESATGESWKDYLRQRIFEPAGMERTTAFASRIYTDDNCAMPATLSDGRWVNSPVIKTDRTMHAAGGMGTTPVDASRWIRLNLNEGHIDGRQVLEPDTVRAIQQYHARIERSGSIRRMDGFGLGWQRGTYRGETPLLSHGGGYIGTSAYMCLLPEKNVGLAILANASPHGHALCDVIAVAVCDALIGREPQDLLDPYTKRIARFREHLAQQRPEGGNPARSDSLTLKPANYVGTYADPHGLGGTIRVWLKDGMLHASVGDLPLSLYATGKDTFTAVITPGMQSGGTFRIENNRVVGLAMEVEDEQVFFEKR